MSAKSSYDDDDNEDDDHDDDGGDDDAIYSADLAAVCLASDDFNVSIFSVSFFFC